MRERSQNYILYGVLVLVIIALVFAFTGFSPNIQSRAANTNINRADTNNPPADESGFKSIDSGTTGAGDVSVELTPHDVVNGKYTVDVAINTHSVDLSQFDLKQITTLEYNGKALTLGDALYSAFKKRRDYLKAKREIEIENNRDICRAF